jgi:hypothetical protein
MSGGQEQARRLALRMVEALIETDSATLSALFAERVVHLPEGRATPRHELIEQCLEKARALAYEPDLGAEDLIDLDAVHAEPLHGEPPPGLQPADLTVTLPLREGDTRQLARPIRCLSQLYVRPGPHPSIVGLGR